MLATGEGVRESALIIELAERDWYAGGGEIRSRRARRSSVLAMTAGLVVFALAAVTLTTATVGRSSPARQETGTGTRPPARVPVSSGVALGGPQDVAAQMASYAPGQSSGWHSHTGLHAVVVLSGTLTIFDGECRRHTYGPGDSYVGGQEIHLAVNETSAPVEMAVTYLFPTGVSHTGFHLAAAAPPGCGAA
jgi:quercetin dioxygenase-like cupin family protein